MADIMTLNPEQPPSSREVALAMFESFRETLDEQNDRYERLVKLSRDLTIQSKRIIFLLHRVAGGQASPSAPQPGTLPSDAARAAELNAARQAREKFAALKPLFEKIKAELVGQEPQRYARAISPGLQEFLESLSFTYYLEHGILISYSDVLLFLDGVPISHEDYLLGVSDLSGELMRYAITAASMVGGRRQKVAEVCHFVRTCSTIWEPCTPYVRGLGKKQQVTNESLKKIEKAAYAIAIRGAEFPEAEIHGVLFEPDTNENNRGRRRKHDDDDDDMEDY